MQPPSAHAKSARCTNTNKPKQMTTRPLNSKGSAAKPPDDQGSQCQTHGRTPRRTGAKTESDNVKGPARGASLRALRRRYARAQPRIPNPPSGKAGPNAGRSIVELQADPAWRAPMRHRWTIRGPAPRRRRADGWPPEPSATASRDSGSRARRCGQASREHGSADDIAKRESQHLG